MTGIALHISPGQVSIAADTAVFAAGPAGGRHQPIGFRGKLLLLSDLRLVLVGRGIGEILYAVYLRLLSDWRIGSADQAFAALPATFCDVTDAFAKTTIGNTDWLDRALFTYMAVGWSEAEGRFLGQAGLNCVYPALYAGRYAPIRLRDGFDVLPALPPDDIARTVAGAPGTEAALTRLMVELKRRCDDVGEGGIGGEVEALTMTRLGTRQRVVHRFPDADDMAAAAALYQSCYDPEKALAAVREHIAPIDVVANDRKYAGRGFLQPPSAA